MKYLIKLPKSIKNLTDDFLLLNVNGNVKSAIKKIRRFKHNQRKIMKSNQWQNKVIVYYGLCDSNLEKLALFLDNKCVEFKNGYF